MAKKRENKFLNFIVVIVLIVFVGSIFIVLGSGNLYKNTSNNQLAPSQIYKSKVMKFSIDVPSKFNVEEDITFVDLVSNNGKVNISRIATNFYDITGYLKDFDSKRKIVIDRENKLNINDKESVVRTEIFIGGPVSKQKVYFIYADNWVYSLSTNSEALFGDLDKIAQSFKYTP